MFSIYSQKEGYQAKFQNQYKGKMTIFYIFYWQRIFFFFLGLN